MAVRTVSVTPTGFVAPGFWPWPSATILPAGQPLAKAAEAARVMTSAAAPLARKEASPRGLRSMLMYPSPVSDVLFARAAPIIAAASTQASRTPFRS
jgi:hypothetical protein